MNMYSTRVVHVYTHSYTLCANTMQAITVHVLYGAWCMIVYLLHFAFLPFPVLEHGVKVSGSHSQYDPVNIDVVSFYNEHHI